MFYFYFGSGGPKVDAFTIVSVYRGFVRSEDTFKKVGQNFHTKKRLISKCLIFTHTFFSGTPNNTANNTPNDSTTVNHNRI